LIIIGGTAVAGLLGTAASYSGWGLDQPQRIQRSVRHGSTHRRHRRGFFYVGRRHGHYGGK
jgi:hypothetical protein